MFNPNSKIKYHTYVLNVYSSIINLIYKQGLYLGGGAI